MTRREIEDYANTLGIHVATWSPGDGKARYRFFRRPGNDYFGPDNGFYTALGSGEAAMFLAGFAAGKVQESAPPDNTPCRECDLRAAHDAGEHTTSWDGCPVCEA